MATIVYPDPIEIVCVCKKLPKFITYGKKYNMIDNQGNYYRVRNNANQIRRYRSSYFMTIEEFRDITIDQIIEGS